MPDSSVILPALVVLTVLLGALIGLLTFVDFYHAGVLTVLTFYFFRGRKWWQMLTLHQMILIKRCILFPRYNK